MVDEAPLFKIEAVLGLGNPGRRYAENRHNFGNMVVDRLAFLKREEFIRGDGPFVYCRVPIADGRLYLCKPTTYMNNSGRAAISLCKYFGIQPQNMLVISDDCNLALGKRKDFPRLRLGVGLNPSGVPLEDYVLEDFTGDEFEIVDQVVSAGIGFIENLAANTINKNSVTFSVTDE